MKTRSKLIFGVVAVIATATLFAQTRGLKTIYTEVLAGGAERMVVTSSASLDVESGGEIDVESGGSLKLAGTAITSTAAELNILDTVTATAAELNLLDTSTAGTIVASKAIVADSNGALADADLLLNSTNEINFTIGAVSLLAIDDAAISGNAAAADTAGKGAFIETQDGGADTAVDGADAGGAFSLKAGDAGAAGADQSGAAGGALTFTSGTGTAGGAHTANDPNGGDGGDITLTVGAGGAAGSGGSGVAGDTGVITLSGLVFLKVQTIDMSDAQVALTLNPGTPAGTEVTGNLLFVDANSAGTENLLLPPEADSTGLNLRIINTGGESILLKDDAGSDPSPAAVTVLTAESADCYCNGTTWFCYNYG